MTDPVLDASIPYAGGIYPGQSTTLRSEVAWLAANFRNNNVLTQRVLDYVQAQDGLIDLARTNITPAQVRAWKTSPTPAGVPPWIITMYPPVDDTEAPVVDMINRAKSSIIISMYGAEDVPAMNAVAGRWNEPGLEILVMVNRNSYLTGSPSMKTNIDSHAEFRQTDRFLLATSDYGDRIMHRKMMIIDGVWRFSGSTNWEDSSMKHQCNEATFIYNQPIASEARAEFDRLRSYVLTKPTNWRWVP